MTFAIGHLDPIKHAHKELDKVLYTILAASPLSSSDFAAIGEIGRKQTDKHPTAIYKG